MSLSQRLLAFAAASALLTAPAIAQPSNGPSVGRPGSLLVFPVFDTRTAVSTALTVTNTNLDRTPCGPARYRSGDVLVHTVYVSATGCSETDRSELLSPGDTLCVDVASHGPTADKGWAWVEARDPETGRTIDYDFLIGSAVITNSTGGFAWEYAPYAFRCLREEANSPFGDSACGFAFAEPAESTTADFDGAEYDLFPQTLLLPRFLGEGRVDARSNDTVTGRLYLMSTKATRSTMDFRFFNNNETMYSRSLNVQCWLESTLTQINGIARIDNLSLMSNPNEFSGMPTGWLKLDGHDGLLGCFLQLRARGRSTTVFAHGSALQFDGTRNDVQFARPRLR
ncbi:MAG: hypothetical protein HYR85_09460 [Planctomycetes bacterium]|nr:hypothetical protein [Planctomycetota bacterium]MBI3847661.1 hypothetical protein [Planctomycetota bacterium]